MSRCVRTVTVTFSNYTRQRKQLDCTALLNSLHPACSLVKDSLTLHLIENQNSTNSVYNIRKVKPIQKCLKLAFFWTASRSYFMRKLWFSDSSAWAAHTQHVGSQLAVHEANTDTVYLQRTFFVRSRQSVGNSCSCCCWSISQLRRRDKSFPSLVNQLPFNRCTVSSTSCTGMLGLWEAAQEQWWLLIFYK